MVLHRLLDTWEESSYCLIKTPYTYDEGCANPVDLELKGKMYQLNDPVNTRVSSSNLVLRSLRFIMNRSILYSFLRIVLRIRKITDIIQSENVNHTILCSGDFENIPAGYIASRKARVPFSLYYFDWYGMQWSSVLRRAIALWIEKRIIKNASSIIVPNESLQEELQERYELHPIVIHNPCSDSSFSYKPIEVWPINTNDVRIIYTGAIYHAQVGAFRNLSLALRILHGSNLSLSVYSTAPQEVLGIEGVSESITFYQHVSPEEAAEIQRKADILFLPLAFKSGIDEVLKSSAPMKMGEYLVSGRPILVHAPSDSFISRYFTKYNCGLVVYNDSPSDLAQAIRKIIEDGSLRHHVVQSAIQRAKEDFNPRVAEEKFRKIIRAGAEV